MSLFSSGKSLSKEKLNQLLYQISALSPEEREYVKAIFNKYSSGGVSVAEARKAVNELKFNYSDNLDPTEVERVKQKILGFFA